MSLELPAALKGRLALEDWGLIPYVEAFSRQKQYVEEIIAGQRLETLVLCSHPPIVTLGRGTRPGDVSTWAGETLDVNRGGRATYHGPSQIIFYPLISLDETSPLAKKIKARDLHQFFRILEESVVETLSAFNITSRGHSVQSEVGSTEPSEATGVWCGDQKIAAIGIAVKKWVVSHGVSLNVDADKNAFQGILPCGFTSRQVTSVEEQLLQKLPSHLEIKKILVKSFCEHLF